MHHKKARHSCDWRALTDHIIGGRSIDLFHKLPPRGHSYSYQTKAKEQEGGGLGNGVPNDKILTTVIGILNECNVKITL